MDTNNGKEPTMDTNTSHNRDGKGREEPTGTRPDATGTTPAPTILSYEYRGHTVRVVMRGGEPWFLAKDVCDILGTRTKDLRAILDADEISNVDTIDIARNGGKTPLAISEPGLYTLVLRSRKPDAKPFRRWVTHDVLPTIRRHGAYMTGDTLERVLDDPDLLIRLATRLKEERTARERAEATITRQAARLAITEPKATMLDDFTGLDATMSVRQAAKTLSNTTGGPIGQNRLFALMEDLGWVFRDHRGHWEARQNHVDAGHLAMKQHVTHGVRGDGTPFAYPPTVRVTRGGLSLLARKLADRCLQGQLDMADADGMGGLPHGDTDQ